MATVDEMAIGFGEQDHDDGEEGGEDPEMRLLRTDLHSLRGMVIGMQNQVNRVQELESQLTKAGQRMGVHEVELKLLREQVEAARAKHEAQMEEMTQTIQKELAGLKQELTEVKRKATDNGPREDRTEKNKSREFVDKKHLQVGTLESGEGFKEWCA